MGNGVSGRDERDAVAAREKSDEAEGRWYSGSGFYDELRRHDAEGDSAHRRRCEGVWESYVKLYGASELRPL